MTRERDEAPDLYELEVEADASVRDTEMLERDANERRGFAMVVLVAAAAAEDDGVHSGDRRPTAPRAAGVGMAAATTSIRSSIPQKEREQYSMRLMSSGKM